MKNSPYVAISDISEQQKTQRLRGKARSNASYEKAMAYLKKEQEFILFEGMGKDRKEFKRKIMTGYEARALNKEYEKKYINGKTKRLWRWVAIEVIEKLKNYQKGSRRKTPGFNPIPCKTRDGIICHRK